jgi:hypothetical protein
MERKSKKQRPKGRKEGREGKREEEENVPSRGLENKQAIPNKKKRRRGGTRRGV